MFATSPDALAAFDACAVCFDGVLVDVAAALAVRTIRADSLPRAGWPGARYFDRRDFVRSALPLPSWVGAE